LENRAYDALRLVERRQLELNSAQRYDKRGRAKSIRSATSCLRSARDSSAEAITLAHDLVLLMSWLRHDVLAVVGLCYDERRDLYDFVVAELKSRLSQYPHRMTPICRHLENQRDDLLAFARVLDEQLAWKFHPRFAGPRRPTHKQS
jgi:hypothetical protein